MNVKNNAVLEVKNISKTIKNKEILKNVSFNLYPNQVTTIIGKSGAGKSSLLRIMNGLTDFENGEIYINNQAINYQSKQSLKELPLKMGLVFQEFNLYPHMTVLDNITLSLRLKKDKTIKEIEEQALSWLKLLQIEGKINNYPSELSGGEKQRVAIARSAILNPQILCFDEPTSALDVLLTKEVAKLTKKLANKINILIVTHDMEFAKEVSDRIIIMNNGEIIGDFTNEAYFKNISSFDF